MSGSAIGALSGLKVIDLSRVLGGPYCSQILADHGASVIKVEPPQGDETRAWGPPFRDGVSSYFTGVNRNKRAMALDLSRTAGRDVLVRLLAEADVVLENFKPGTLEKWGISGKPMLGDRFPRLIHCRISGFGADGPLGGAPGYDAIAQAMSGLMSVNGSPDSGATRIGVPLVDMGTGLNATIGILMAVIERGRSGRGQFVDMTLFDTAVSLLHPHSANWFFSGRIPEPLGNAHPNIAPYDKFETATGAVFIGIGNDGQFRRLCERLGREDLAEDARFRDNQQRSTNRHLLRDELESALMQTDGMALCEALLQAGVPAGPLYNVEQVMEHPHTRHRGMVAELDGYRGVGTPVKLSRTPGRVRRKPPRFGQDTREVLAEHGYSESEIDALVAAKIVTEATG